jgi:hypothetical protein
MQLLFHTCYDTYPLWSWFLHTPCTHPLSHDPLPRKPCHVTVVYVRLYKH